MALRKNRHCGCLLPLVGASDGCVRLVAPPVVCFAGGTGKGAVDGKDREGKAANYALVQELAEEFKKRNGSMICAELLGLKKPEGSSTPEARTEQYYAKRPCAKWWKRRRQYGPSIWKNSRNKQKLAVFMTEKRKKGS